MTEKAIRDDLDSLKDSSHELDGFKPIEASVSHAPRAVFSLRIGPQELEAIETAAGVVEENLGEFIRRAALLRVGEVMTHSSAIDEIRQKARELNEAIGKL